MKFSDVYEPTYVVQILGLNPSEYSREPAACILH